MAMDLLAMGPLKIYGGRGRNRLAWISKALQPDFEAKEDRQTYGTNTGRFGFEPGRI